MKKHFNASWLLAAAFTLSFATPALSQKIKKEMDGLAKKFEASYNKKDDKALKSMYTDDAVRTDPDGTVITGNENIRMKLTESWTINNLAIEIKTDKVDSLADGTVIAVGTYHVTGSTNAGEKIDVNGGYTNTVVKDKGTWKIAKSVLTSL